MTRPVILLFLAASVLTANGAAGNDVAVVVDVSGSMRSYGSWQADAKDAVSALLTGRPLNSQWVLTPKGADLRLYAAKGEEHVALVRFGSVRTSAGFPYFDDIRRSLSVAGVESEFPTSPSNYTENRTNNALAEAVAISIVGGNGNTARAIMLSDFLADARMSQDQLEFVNDTQSKFAKYTDATLSWVGNPRVQIKLLRFVPLLSAPSKGAADSSELGSLQLLRPRYDNLSQSVLLAWKYDGSGTPEKYDVKVIDAREGIALFSKYNLGTKSVTYAKAIPGTVRWSVIAYMPNGRTVEQSATFVVPKSGGSPIAFIIFVIAIACGLAVGIIALKKHGFPSLFARLKRRTDADV